MLVLVPRSLLVTALSVGLLALSGFAAGQSINRVAPAPAGNTDFSGAWELDYSASDNARDELNRLVRELRRRMERQSQGGNRGPNVSIGGAGSNSGNAIMGLAEMADMITESTLLDIEQDENLLQVKREGNFALVCEYFGGESTIVKTPLGSETCGWSGHQMVFRIFLPEGLSIQHVLTLGPSGQRLNIATTVRSDYVSWPFTLNKVFNRYDPEAGGIRCEQTLTRGRVCTTEARE